MVAIFASRNFSCLSAHLYDFLFERSNFSSHSIAFCLTTIFLASASSNNSSKSGFYYFDSRQHFVLLQLSSRPPWPCQESTPSTQFFYLYNTLTSPKRLFNSISTQSFHKEIETLILTNNKRETHQIILTNNLKKTYPISRAIR